MHLKQIRLELARTPGSQRQRGARLRARGTPGRQGSPRLGGLLGCQAACTFAASGPARTTTRALIHTRGGWVFSTRPARTDDERSSTRPASVHGRRLHHRHRARRCREALRVVEVKPPSCAADASRCPETRRPHVRTVPNPDPEPGLSAAGDSLSNGSAASPIRLPAPQRNLQCCQDLWARGRRPTCTRSSRTGPCSSRPTIGTKSAGRLNCWPRRPPHRTRCRRPPRSSPDCRTVEADQPAATGRSLSSRMKRGGTS